MRVAILRLLIVLCVVMVTMTLAAMFAGIGYLMLVFAVFHLVVTVAFYEDRLYAALVGKERFSAQANSIRRTRESLRLRVLFLINNVVFFAVAVFVILAVNVKLIDLG